MTPTMHFEFGDTVLVRFPFTNQLSFKQRPAVIVCNESYSNLRPDVVIMAITSQLRATAAFGEMQLADWAGAGLLKASAVKPVFATIEQVLVLRHLGRLQAADQAALRTTMAAVLG